MTKRLFLAIDLPEKMKEELVDWQESHAKILNVRWTPKENLHITTVFLGEVALEKLGDLGGKLKTGLSGGRKFILRFDRIVWSLEQRDYGMIWAEFKASKEFDDLVAASRLAVRDFIEVGSSRKQVPHATLARFKEPIRKIELSQPGLGQNEFWVEGVNLMESELTSERPYYKTMESFKLGN